MRRSSHRPPRQRPIRKPAGESQHCAACHAVSAGAGKDVIAAPPFEALARKFASSPDTLAYSLRNPHPKMNVTLSRREMEDVASYINSLAK